jgi:replicative DNA helicase
VGIKADGIKKLGKEPGWVSTALGGMKNGNIDDTLFAVCSRLRGDGYTAEDARILLQPHAEKAGAEPGHLEAKIENVWTRYEPNKTSIGNISEGLRIHSPADPNSWNLYEQRGILLGGERLQSGFAKLDSLFARQDLRSERLFTVGALTGHGKTNFGIGLAKNLCESSKKVLYFSTEYSYAKIWERYIGALQNPDSFRSHQFNVCDGFTPNIEQVEEAIEKIKPDIFIFDYIQHVSKEKEHLTAFMKGCQFLQRKYKTQGVILAQLNRGADWVEAGKRVEPRLSMIEGSATIEQASSRVLLLSMSKSLPEYHEITGYLAKNDDGDTGIVQFALYRNPYHLEEL